MCMNPICKKSFKATPGSFGKYCSLSCGTSHRNQIRRIDNITKYNLSPKKCKQCKGPIDYDSSSNKFCSKSCAAKYNNSKKDWTKIKTGPKKFIGPKSPRKKNVRQYTYSSKGEKIEYTKIKQCIICNRYHPKFGKTCSKPCKSIYQSYCLRGKTGGNRDINLPGIDCDGNKFYYDSRWEISLANSFNENNIHWIRPNRFILSDGRSYTPDFYLKDYDIYIDPKAKRPGYYRKSVLKIEMFEKENNAKCLIISNSKWLTWDQVLTMMIVNNNRA